MIKAQGLQIHRMSTLALFGSRLTVMAALSAIASVVVASPPRHDRLPTGPLRLSPSRPADRLPSHVETASGRLKRPADRGVFQISTPTHNQQRFDDRTEREGRLEYGVVFEPTIAPFKRSYCFERVDANGQLRRALNAVPIEARGGPDRLHHELFWGAIRVQLEPNQRGTLPSVSPSSRLIAWVSEPKVKLQMFRDANGIWSVSSPQEHKAVSLRYLMDAPSRYFGSPLGSGVTHLDPWKPKLAQSFQTKVEALWPTLGLSTQLDRKERIEALTRWFRSFEPGGTSSGRDLLQVIAQRQGVCRHRTHGFVVVAHSLGISARYVGNEAHAFVEVWVRFADAREGWLRIDLGGGAEQLHLRATGRRNLHRPLQSDALPKPIAFRSHIGRVAGALSMAGASKVTIDHPVQMNTTPKGHLVGTPTQPRILSWIEHRARRLAGQKIRELSDPRSVSTLTIQGPEKAWRRGGLKVRGQLNGPAQSLPKQRIELWLISPVEPTKAIHVGSMKTGAQGHFQGQVRLDRRVGLGPWDLVAYFAGSPQLAACYSQSPKHSKSSGDEAARK